MSNPYKIDWNEYAALARQAVAEGCVLLKNDDKALPIRKGERVSVFGRIQFDYYKSGTGSGGAVNTRYVTNILDALKENKDISVNEELEQTYRDWLKDHPFEKGMGWAQEPWCQEEMPVTKELAEQAAAKSDIAVVIIGRTAGEDKDNSAAEGSYLLTAAEHQMLKEVCGAFKRVAVLLNVGNIIDMKWVKEYDPAAVLYVWQGGQEGGAGAADVLTGTVTPCGKLSDTIALDISDYPSTEGFGDPTRVIYKEDIYVGYRYFETFAKDCVLYPFGYGLSYTTFTRTVESFDFDGETVTEKVTVKNTGDVQGKEVVTVFVEAPQREYDMAARSAAALKPAKPYTGDKGIKLGDVFDGKAELEDFVAQLSDEDLICLMRGEGMNSPKVTAGTAGAFGGVTENLVNFGIPTACCADGPSGIRMDCGTVAFSLPNGTLLACTFNEKLNEELFAMQGKEQRKNRVDTLLGPGLNIHRSPLNGRNFEYFSEDPLLTGKLAAAQLRGMRRFGVTGTIKHFACNNQEFKRTEIDSVLSERALREIYLRAFETAVKEGGAYSVMSTYGGLNGIWTASNFDLLTTILRDEWGFTGTVMTDWWAKGNDCEGEEATRENVAAQVRAQNDLNMVNADAASNSQHDNLDDALADGRLTRDALVRSAMNICRTVMNSPVMERSLGRMSDEEREAAEAEKTSEDYVDFNGEYQFIDDEAPLDISAVNTEKGASTVLGIRYKKNGLYKFVMRVKANANEVAQIPMSIFIDGNLRGMVMINGTNGEVVTAEQDIGVLFGGTNYLKLYFGQTGMEIEEIKFVCTQAF